MPKWTSGLTLVSSQGNGLLFPCSGVSSTLQSSATLASSWTWAGWSQADPSLAIVTPLDTNSTTTGTLLFLTLSPSPTGPGCTESYFNVYLQNQHVVSNNVIPFCPSTFWQFYALSYDAVQDLLTFTVNGTVFSSSHTGLIGGLSWASGSLRFFDNWVGVVRDVYVWDVALIPANLTAVYLTGVQPNVWSPYVFLPQTLSVDQSVWLDVAANSHFVSGVLQQSTTTTTTSQPLQPWTMHNVSETYCHVADMVHTPTAGVQWSVKIGSAGQLYSIAINGVELMGMVLQTNYPFGVWLDAVHQVVPTSNPSVQSIAPWSGASFIQAGQYPKNANTVPYYAQVVDQVYDATRREMRVMSWLPQAGTVYGVDWQQVLDGQSLRAEHLLQTAVRDVGDVDGQAAVLELSYTSTNYGKWVLDNMNQDWSPLLNAPIPYRWMSANDGSFALVDNTVTFQTIDPTLQNGWVMWSSGNDTSQLGTVLTYVYGAAPNNMNGLTVTDYLQVGTEFTPEVGGFNLLSTVYGIGKLEQRTARRSDELSSFVLCVGNKHQQQRARGQRHQHVSVHVGSTTMDRSDHRGTELQPTLCGLRQLLRLVRTLQSVRWSAHAVVCLAEYADRCDHGHHQRVLLGRVRHAPATRAHPAEHHQLFGLSRVEFGHFGVHRSVRQHATSVVARVQVAVQRRRPFGSGRVGVYRGKRRFVQSRKSCRHSTVHVRVVLVVVLRHVSCERRRLCGRGWNVGLWVGASVWVRHVVPQSPAVCAHGSVLSF